MSSHPQLDAKKCGTCGGSGYIGSDSKIRCACNLRCVRDKKRCHCPSCSSPKGDLSGPVPVHTMALLDSLPSPEAEVDVQDILGHLRNRIQTELDKHASYMDHETMANCITAKMKTCISEHLSQAREEQHRKCIEAVEQACDDFGAFECWHVQSLKLLSAVKPKSSEIGI